MVASDLSLLTNDASLMVFIRFMQLTNTFIFFITIRIIQIHSTRSVGMYKYCLYQIVLWPSISQLCTILGPIFVLPVIGAYHYIDFTDNPGVVHGILCVWIIMCSFDIASILDGFNFRLRILLLSSHPRFAFKPYWIFTYFSSKVVATIFVVFWIAPIGQYLNRDEMREYLVDRYPKVIRTFDAYKTFVVYNVKELPGFWEAMFILLIVVVLVFCYGISVVIAIFKLLHNKRSKMSIGTQRMHTRFLSQLSTQACVPFFILLCPLFALVILTLFEFQFQSNAPGYAITIFLIMHAPITSLLTLYLYTPYRKAILNYWNERILRRRRVEHTNNYSLSNANFVTVSSKRKM